MIIECNGLPGTGKTTLIQASSKRLFNKGIHHRVVGVSSFRNGNGFAGKFKRLSLLLHPTIFWTAFSSKATVDSIKFLSFKERITTLMYLRYLLNEFENGDSIVLSDEGLVQTLATVLSFTNKESTDIKKAKNLLQSGKITELNCNLSIDDAMNRIALRNRHDSAIDLLKGSELRNYLLFQSKQLNIVRFQCTNFKNLDMKNDIYQLVDIVELLAEG